MNKNTVNFKTLILEAGFLFIMVLLPVVIIHFFQTPPKHRYIHVENFRYGKEPAEIHCNRGDTLHITLSSRDTGHSFFIQEFDLDAKISPGNNTILKFKALNPSEPYEIVDEILIVAEHPGIYKYLISKSSIHCHVWCGPMHAFEHGHLIIEPNTLLYGGTGLLLGIFLIGIRRKKRSANSGEPVRARFETGDEGIDLFQNFPRLKTILQKRWLQPALMLFAAFILYLVILITIFGTQMAGRNLGVLLIWIVWLFLLIIIFTPLGGRIWCMVCPIPTAGEFLQRRAITRVKLGKTNDYRNKFYGLQLKWPEFLNNGWVRLVLFLLLGTFSTTLSTRPAMTGYAILLLVILSLIMALIFEHRSFCRYICPINAFIALYSKTGRLALRKADAGICSQCKGNYCEKGSKYGYACPYGLNVGNIRDNFDCGMCTECLKSCIYDNVTLKWRTFASEIKISSISRAWTSMAMFVLVSTYTIVYLGPWAQVRDYVNIIDKGNWDLFAVYSLLLWSTALVLFPLVLYLITWLSQKLSHAEGKPFEIFISSTGTLIPISLFIWAAFIVQMLFVNVTFLQQAFSDPFGWGWNLFGQASTPWIQFLPRWIPWIQVLLAITGFILSFRNSWRFWMSIARDSEKAFKGFLPLVSFYCLMALAFIYFYAN